jgi:hypothetical protein
MTQHTSPRTMARQNLLVAAVNEALTRQLITLEHFPTRRNRKGFPCGANRDSS